MVVVVPTAAAERRRWAARATVALARAWGREGAKVFLADLSARRPILHEVLGVENGEGVSDALLYGASIRRIAVSTDEPFFFAPAGTVVPDTEPVLGHSRWGALTRGFSSAGVTLLLYAPLDLPGAPSLLQRASEVILLATEAEASGAELEGADGKVSLVLGPEGELPSEPESDEGAAPTGVPAGAPEDPEDGEPAAAGGPAAPSEPAAAGRPAQAGEAAAAGKVAQAPGREPTAPRVAPEATRKRRRRGRSSRVEVLVLVLVLVLGGAVLGAYYGYLDVPWLSPYLEQLEGGEAAPGEAAPPTTPPASPEDAT